MTYSFNVDGGGEFRFERDGNNILLYMQEAEQEGAQQPMIVIELLGTTNLRCKCSGFSPVRGAYRNHVTDWLITPKEAEKIKEILEKLQ